VQNVANNFLKDDAALNNRIHQGLLVAYFWCCVTRWRYVHREIETGVSVIRFVIPVVFNKTIRAEYTFLSNTTFYLMVEVYLHLLPKVQLHVSAPDNSHLKVYMNP